MLSTDKRILTLVPRVFCDLGFWRVLHNAAESFLGVVFLGVSFTAGSNDVAVAVAEPPAPFISLIAEEFKPGERLR